MGISGLAKRLEPYATRYTPEDLDGYAAIIDGPSLAYHAQQLALAAAASRARLPSYADVNQQAIHWLESLEDMNIKVSAVLFDGALPMSKRDERISRLQQNNRKIRDFRLSYPTPACPIPTQLGPTAYSFLAPALREALVETQFAPITRAVPGEADDFCMPYANDSPRSIIFSSDTDLVLYSYPHETLIAFFRDVELTPVSKFRAYSPFQIRRTLNLNSLVPYAYALTQHGPWIGHQELVQEARGYNVDNSEYLAFSKRYVYTVTALTPPYMSKDSGIVLQNLDVRVSEFVHQALGGLLMPEVFLPLLVEDANAASAWNMGQNFRFLAYSLLASNCLAIKEYKRRAQSMSTLEMKPYSPADVCTVAAKLAHDLSTWRKWTESKEVAPQLVWPLLATSMVLVDLKFPPQIPLLVAILKGEFDNTWEFMQLTARIQAVLYSFRILKQTISIWLSTNPDEKGDLFPVVLSLQQNLATVSKIADTFVVPGQAKIFQGNDELLKSIVKDVYEFVKVPIPEERKSKSQRKKEKREREKNRAEGTKTLSGQGGVNLFSILGDQN